MQVRNYKNPYPLVGASALLAMLATIAGIVAINSQSSTIALITGMFVAFTVVTGLIAMIIAIENR